MYNKDKNKIVDVSAISFLPSISSIILEFDSTHPEQGSDIRTLLKAPINYFQSELCKASITKQSWIERESGRNQKSFWKESSQGFLSIWLHKNENFMIILSHRKSSWVVKNQPENEKVLICFFFWHEERNSMIHQEWGCGNEWFAWEQETWQKVKMSTLCRFIKK